MSRASLLLVVVMAVGIFGLQAASQQQQEPTQRPPIIDAAPGQPNVKRPDFNAVGREIIQEFPTGGPAKTAWKITWATIKGFGLVIKDARFQRGPGEPFIQVLGDLRLGEMFVPYHSGSPRFWDVSYNFSLTKLGLADVGANGKLLGDNTVAVELRDRGLMYMDFPKGSRRGQALVLWGCLDAANYRYIIEYGFQDDGAITCRVGSTGRNYASREFEGHMHHAMWRVDLNIDGSDNNSVYVMEHVEPDPNHPEKARTESRLFNDGKEGFEDWKAQQFTMLTVLTHKKKNQRGKPLAYDVCVPRMGVARHYGADDEGCTQHDFWVTKNRPNQMNYRKIPDYIKNSESIVNTDVVVWVNTACHHEPRSEDGEMTGANFRGATLVAWSGFELRPRNFFDRTPMYNYPVRK